MKRFGESGLEARPSHIRTRRARYIFYYSGHGCGIIMIAKVLRVRRFAGKAERLTRAYEAGKKKLDKPSVASISCETNSKHHARSQVGLRETVRNPAQRRRTKSMSRKLHVARLSLCLFILGLVAGIPALAGSAVIGSVAGSRNATLGGQTLLPNTILFSGDNLQVRDGLAVVAVGNTNRMVFGRDTTASFLRGSNEVTVLLGQGNVSVFHAEDTVGVRVKVGDVSVIPVSGFRTLGEVAMLNGAMVVTAKEGMLRVEGNGQVKNVAKGKTITVYPGANAPQTGGNPPSGKHMSGAEVWGVTGTVVGGAGLVLAAVAESRASDAKDNANSAIAAADAAASAANAAASAANAAASSALYNSISVGCALNTLANAEDQPSPYTPPGSATCSNPATW